MSLKLMFITNRPEVAKIAEDAGVDRIFIDMEYIGKALRQGGLDSVQNHHTIEDIANVRNAISKADLLVRVNPIHPKTDEYCSSDAGADIVMLPYFKTTEEVSEFISIVNGRAKTMLLLETPEAANAADDILKIKGIDEIHIGINDLSLGYKKPFMFQMLSDGTVEKLCLKFRMAGIPYGFGGVASIGSGMLPAEAILKEHYRLGSSMVILSRSFCMIKDDTDLDYVREKFETGVRTIRSFEKEISVHSTYFAENRKEVAKCVDNIVKVIQNKKNCG